MKLSNNRTQVPDAPVLFKEAMYIIGRQLNDWSVPDLASNFTIGHKGDEVTYAIEVKEVGRRPILIDGESTVRHIEE